MARSTENFAAPTGLEIGFPRESRRPGPSVRFVAHHRVVSDLEVEGPAEQVSAARVREALFALRVQVVGSHAWRGADVAGERLRVCEFDGAPLSERRRRAIVLELEAALESGAVGPGIKPATPRPRSGERSAA